VQSPFNPFRAKIKRNQKKKLTKRFISSLICMDMEHLREANMGYWQHWWHAMSCGIALIIHAWFPWILKDYTSKRICKK
jgi:hypothetical protein